MKAYKIDLSGFTGKVLEVVSEAVQKKAFALGYKWPRQGNAVIWISDPVLFCEPGGDILRDLDTSAYASDPNTAITAADFLALETAKEPEFKTFDKVIRRDADDEEWNADWFSHKGDTAYPYYCTASCFKQCIPYEGNEHLVGKTDGQKESR